MTTMTGSSLAASPTLTHTALRRELREARAAHRVPCRIRAADLRTGQTLILSGETVNLSRSGLAVQLGRDVSAGAEVEAQFIMPDGRPALLLGRVVRSRRVLSGTFEIGIEMTPDSRTR